MGGGCPDLLGNMEGLQRDWLVRIKAVDASRLPVRQKQNYMFLKMFCCDCYVLCLLTIIKKIIIIDSEIIDGSVRFLLFLRQ